MNRTLSIPHRTRLAGCLALAALLLAATGRTAAGQGATPPPWSGYVQTRFTDDYADVTGFSVRRAKLWIRGKAPAGAHWYYKVQSLFRYQNAGALVLQDVYAEYRRDAFTLRFGQQVPAFSLQRSRPDYRIPLIERARAVDALIPAAETLARDVGVQALWHTPDGRAHVAFGVFNGNGANRKGNENRHFLFTHRAWYRAGGKALSVQIGYSLAYRRAGALAFRKILDPSARFSGDDFRWGVDARLEAPHGRLQAEYLEARLGSDAARGWYALAAFDVTPRDELALSVDRYDDLVPETSNRPWFILGLNHFFAGHRLQASLDNRIRFRRNHTDIQTTAQLQLFFN